MNFINIEDIMMRNQALVVENQALRLRIEELKNGFEGCCMACEPVGEMNKKLREERDEALKRIDELEDVCGDSADRMVELVKERDEARRMYCKAVADHYEYACNAELDGAGPYTQKDVAKDEGWDCFKGDGK